MSRPLSHHYSAYTARQVKRFAADGWSYAEIAARMDLPLADIPRLARTKNTKALPVELSGTQRDFAPRSLPIADTSGRSYSTFPLKRSAYLFGNGR